MVTFCTKGFHGHNSFRIICNLTGCVEKAVDHVHEMSAMNNWRSKCGFTLATTDALNQSVNSSVTAKENKFIAVLRLTRFTSDFQQKPNWAFVRRTRSVIRRQHSSVQVSVTRQGWCRCSFRFGLPANDRLLTLTCDNCLSYPVPPHMV